ncbi:H/ACA ribonucleoprotein complex non-core subunit NAF1-like [Trifolium pratense]|nr:H/ACA ribonucleoprotein complex non-core subunit NAF1-like [Trifolium pratense]
MDDDDDFALADSFINFDYAATAAAYSPTTSDNNNNNPPDLPIVESGSSDLDLTVGNSGVQELFQSFSLVENEVNEIENAENRGEIIGNDDNAVEIRSDVIANNDYVNDIVEIRDESEIITNDNVNEIESESTTDSESESESESEDENELEEGEIVDSEVNVNDDSEEITSWGSDDSDDDQSRGRCHRLSNELEDLPWIPPVNVNLGPHHKMLPVGVVTSIVGAKVIVEGVEKHAPLNEGSILWITERQTPLGLIDEIFGQVTSPYYVVRYNSKNYVPEGICKGTLVSFVAEFVNHVLDDKDLYEKGYDEGLSDETEFSDDEKEDEYKKRQKQNKRATNNRNPKTMVNNRKKFPPNNVSVPTMPVAPATPLVAHGHCRPPMPGTGQDFFGAAHGHSSSLPSTGQGFSGTPNLNPPFPPVNGGPNLVTTGVLPNGVPLPPQQSVMPANGFPTNGVSWHPENTQFSHQLPTQGIPYQQQFNPSHRFPPPNAYPGGQPNMYAHGPMNQNQQSPFPQFQAPTKFHPSSIPCNQGGPPNQFNPPTNFHSNSFPGNQGGAPNQFNPPTNFYSNSFPGNQCGAPNQFNPPTNFHSSSISRNQGGPPNQFNAPTNFHSSSISSNQGGPPNQFNPPTNFLSNYCPGNQHPPQSNHQFNPGAYDGRGRTFSAGRGRRPFHRGGRGWRPAR